MVAFDIYDFEKQVTGNIELNDSVFSSSINEIFLHQVMVSYQANKRQGTASAKSRSEVAGTRTKPFRQKGTGRARQGFIRAPQYRGGACQFGPIPRSYRKDIPKKMKQEAFRQTLSMKAEKGQFFILNNLEFDEIKTKKAADILKSFAMNGRTLFLDVKPMDNVLLSIRNIDKTSVLSINSCSPLDIFESDTVFLTQDAAQELGKRYLKSGGAGHEE